MACLQLVGASHVKFKACLMLASEPKALKLATFPTSLKTNLCHRRPNFSTLGFTVLQLNRGAFPSWKTQSFVLIDTTEGAVTPR